jgi:hypothetical protein
MKNFFDSIATSGARLFVALLQLILAASVAAAQSPQAFTPTGNLNTGRNEQRAIPLNDGTILVTGGYDINGNGLASTELYHPTTGVFTTAGSLSTARRNFAITTLDNGTVLVTGGYDNNFNSLASAEIYDPASGTFTATGSLGTARADHTATRLSDGTVLIAGGDDGSGNSLSSAELYIPSTGAFIATGSLNAARGFATATALIDGTVLLAGGWGNGTALATAELYHPATHSFTATGSLNVGRTLGTATLLNGGTVLIAGGEDSGGGTLSQAELYDPVSKTFTLTGSLNTARGDHAATLLTNGTVLVEGGFACQPLDCTQSSVDMTPSAEIYNPVSATFTATGPLTVARQVHTATLLGDGTVLVAGGWSDFNRALTSAEVYQPATFEPANLVSITVSPGGPSLTVGTSQALVATGTFVDLTTQTLVSPIWSSLDNTVATVTNDSGGNSGVTNDSSNSGVVFGVAAGSTTVTACTGTICGSATVTVSQGTATISPSSLTFPDTAVGTTSAAQTITLTNTGPLSTIQVTGDFQEASNNCVPIPSSGTCMVQVIFAPTAGGPLTGTISFNDSATGSPQIVTLSGSGIDFGLSATNMSANVAAGGTTTYQLSVNSIGGNIGSAVNLSCSGAPDLATCSVSPSSVTPGSGSSSVTVSVTTTGPSAVLTAPAKESNPVTAWFSLSQDFGIFGMLLLGQDGRRKKRAYFLVLVVLLVGILVLTGCSGTPIQTSSAAHATPAGTYHLLLVGQSASAQHVITLTLNVR